MAVLAGLALIRLLLRRVARWTAFALARGGASASARIGSGMAATLARMALHLASVALLSWAALTSGLLGPRAAIFVATLTEAALALVAVYALASAYLAPRAAALRVAPLDDRRARKALRRALALAGVAAAEHVLLRPLYRADASEAALSVVNFALVATGGLLLWRLQSVFARALPAVATQPAQAVADAPELVEPPASLAEQAADMVRTATQVVAVAAPALAAMGYLAASRALFLPFVGSLGVLGLALLAHGLIRVATGGGRVAALRDPTQHDPAPPAPSGGAIAPAASAAALLALSLPPLAMVWGADRTVLAAVWRAVVEGVDLGSLRIAPLDLLTFLAIFASGYALTRIAQRIVAASGPGGGKGATEGARAALVSIMGYAGVILSAGVAVSSVGLDLSNLALLAGALSVGVGFGLQGIVNNFISGVILQIEQPVKVGDWIEVNGVHGLVRRITVRSTVIETFDRAAYVVPNADLVAHPVTNYTHRNRLGRLILRLTVPYESDPRLVERILGEIHQAAPNSRRWPGSGAFLTGFGSSGYEFELRVILRDITGFVAAGSALRLEIADRFRAEGVAFAVARHDVRFMQDPATAVDAGPKPVES